MKLGHVAQFHSGPTFQVAGHLSGPIFTPIFKVSATYSEEEIGPAGVQVDRQLDK